MRPRLSYANVMSTLCFFLLLGGGAYAASHLAKNSVGSKQHKKNAITILGSKNNIPTDEGGVLAPGGAEAVSLDGVTFRAES